MKSNRPPLLLATFICLMLLPSLIVHAQANPLILNYLGGLVEVSSDGGGTFLALTGPADLAEGAIVRWGEDGSGAISGPGDFAIAIAGGQLGAGSLEIDSLTDPEVTSGIRIQQLSGQVAYVRESAEEQAALNDFLPLENPQQAEACQARQARYANPGALPGDAFNQPLAEPFVKLVDSSDDAHAFLEAGWLFMGVDDAGVFSDTAWTMDAEFSAHLQAFSLNHDLTQPDFDAVDRACAGLFPDAMTQAAKPSGIMAKAVAAPSAQDVGVVPAPGTEVTYTFDPVTNTLIIEMSPGGNATFTVPEGGLPYNIQVQVDGFIIDIEPGQAGDLTLSSDGDGTLLVAGTAGGTVTTPQGVTLDIPNSADGSELAITDNGSDPVIVDIASGEVAVNTNSVATTIALPGDNVINVPAGQGNFAVTVSVEDNGAYNVTAGADNPAPLDVVDAAGQPVVTVAPGEASGPTCPDGVQPSGIGGPCAP